MRGIKMPIEFTAMDGYEFEDYISGLFRRLGFEVEATNYSNDGGIDLVATYNQPVFSGKYIIQCKNWTGPVGQPEVRDLYGVVMDQRANKGILITPSDYTQQAYDFANGKNIELINGSILSGLLKTDSENNTASKTPKVNNAFRNERYFYYQKAIAEEPKNVSNYLQMIGYLRDYVKSQNREMCTIELFEDIIRWTEQFANRCYKAPSKLSEKQNVLMFKAEALIHIGSLAEATELMLRCERFFIRNEFGNYNMDRTILYGYMINSWNLYTAYKLINYERGCNLLLSKREVYERKIPPYFGNLFVYFIPKMMYASTGTTKYLNITGFCEKESKNPKFFYDRFYTKTHEEYAKEIDTVFKLHGLI